MAFRPRVSMRMIGAPHLRKEGVSGGVEGELSHLRK